MQSFDLKCQVSNVLWMGTTRFQTCRALNLIITSMNETITSVNGRTEPTSLPAFWIQTQTTHYLPKGLGKFFPNLKVIAVRKSSLKSVTQDDLKSFTQLFRADFMDNNLEKLEDDLFEFNPMLQQVRFDGNKLYYIGGNLLSNLKNLKLSEFMNNPCINVKATTSSGIPALVQKIKLQCRWPQDPVLIREIERLKIENAELKNQSNQQLNELNSANSTIIALKAESTRQANLIKEYEIQHGNDEDSIRKQNAIIGQMNSEIFALKAENSRQADSIKACGIQQGKDEDSIKQLNETIGKWNSEMSALKAENILQANLIRQMNATIGETKKELDLQAKVIEILKRDLTTQCPPMLPTDSPTLPPTIALTKPAREFPALPPTISTTTTVGTTTFSPCRRQCDKKTGGGTVPSRTNCKKYYECRGGMQYPRTCSGALAFDAASGVCVDAGSASCVISLVC